MSDPLDVDRNLDHCVQNIKGASEAMAHDMTRRPVPTTDTHPRPARRKMSIPTGDNAFLHELELNVRAELTLAETSEPEEEAAGLPIDEWLSDPVDDQRYEVNLRGLLGAVEALEDGSCPGGHPLSAEMPASVEAAGPGPAAPTGTPRRKVDRRCRSHDNTWLTYCG